MAVKVLNKVNSTLRFLYRKQSILNGPLRRLLCNALIQPHFDYASQAWYPNLTKTLSIKLQHAQNKCIRFCLNLDNRAHLQKKKKSLKIKIGYPLKKGLHRMCVTACQKFSYPMTWFKVHGTLNIRFEVL